MTDSQKIDGWLDRFYGAGMHSYATEIINELAPVTRRDEWWATDGPYEIIAKHVANAISNSHKAALVKSMDMANTRDI
jgi:hypothetical protein